MHEVVVVQLAAGWVKHVPVTPKIRESNDHPRSFTVSQYHQALPTPPFLHTTVYNKQSKHVAVIITPKYGW